MKRKVFFDDIIITTKLIPSELEILSGNENSRYLRTFWDKMIYFKYFKKMRKIRNKEFKIIKNKGNDNMGRIGHNPFF